jgi:membrane-associated phospholipid phosphatase
VLRVFAWTIAPAIVAFVAVARMYRGMHYPLDVAGGVVVGIAAVIALVFACRTAGAAAELREDPRSRGGGRA